MEAAPNPTELSKARSMYHRATLFVAFEPWPRRLAVGLSALAALPVVLLMLVLSRTMSLWLDAMAPGHALRQFGRHGGTVVWPLFDHFLAGTSDEPMLEVLAIVSGLSFSWAILYWLGEWFSSRSAARTGERLRLAGFHQAMRLGALSPLPDDLANSLDRGVEAVQVALRRSNSGLPRAITGLFLAMAAALVLSPWFALLSVAASCLAWSLGRACLTLGRSKSKEEERQLDQSLGRLKEIVHDMPAIKAQGMDVVVRDIIAAELATAANHQVANRGFATMGRAGATLAVGAVLLAWMITGFRLVADGTVGLSDFVFLGLCQPMLAHWFLGLSRSRDAEHRAALAAKGLFTFLDQRGKVRQVPGAHVPGPLAQGLEFDHVQVKAAGKTTLTDLSLVVPARSKVALVGGTDVEKRTLLGLVTRLADPDHGEVRWDGISLKLCRIESLRAAIGWAVAPFVVVSGSISENILAGRDKLSDGEVEAATRATHLDRFLRALPEARATRVGHGGAQLSGLTEYLIALSRALVGNPSLLIVEEPDIELSTDERALVNDALLRAFEDRAVLLIARTLNAIAACDQVVMIDHGRVTAHGTHADLMAKSSAYRDLVHRELSGSLASPPAR